MQLSIPGLGPVNELTLARAFARGQDERAKTFVFMIETFWCATDEHNMFHYPNFPNWLYEEDDLTYLREMFSIDSAQAALHRLAIRLGLAPEAARRDGYVPKEGQPDRAATLAHAKRPTDAPAKPWTFFAIERLENFRQIIDPRIELVLLLMPFHVSALPEPGSAAQEWLEACKTRARAMAETRPRTIFIDRLRDDEIARDANNFWDAKHVRDPIIRKLENEIAAALRVARESERWKDSRLRTQPIQHDAAPVTRP